MNRQIIEAVQKMTGTQLRDNVILISANVDSVDESTRSCVVTTIGGAATVTIENVQLMASVDDGILIIPKVDSTVFVCYSTFNLPFVCQFSAVDKVVFVAGQNNVTLQIINTGVLLEINNTKLELTDGKTTFNDGQLGGLVKIAQLTTKLNNLENLVNDLVSKYNTHTHVLALSTGTGTAAATLTQETTVLTPTQQADIEDDKIVH